jgi:hypothetical protein
VRSGQEWKGREGKTSIYVASGEAEGSTVSRMFVVGRHVVISHLHTLIIHRINSSPPAAFAFSLLHGTHAHLSIILLHKTQMESEVKRPRVALVRLERPGPNSR